MDSKRYLLPILLMLALFPLFGQSDFYWENEQILVSREARFPRVVSTEEALTAVWQEFNEEEGTVTFRMITSEDGINWTSPVTIGEPVTYFWEDQVSLFSLLAKKDGTLYMAFPEDEQTIGVFRLDMTRDELVRETQILAETTSLAPRLYEKADGSLILFSTQSIQGSELETSSLHIFSSEESGGTWTEPAFVINDEELSWNFLPDFYSWDGREYMVFQSLYTGARITWQLYIQSRDAGSLEWSAPVLLTDRDEFYEGENQEAVLWDNQRPHLSAGRDGLTLTWERHFSQLSPQIYLARLDRDGLPLGDFIAVTDGYRYNANPRYFEYEEGDYVLWFDNRDGNQVVMTELETSYLGGERMSRGQGNSSYAMPVLFKGDLFLFWENQLSDRYRLVLLAPDKTVDQPRLLPVSFTPGERNRKSLVTISWTAPDDSSGIEGYLYSWDRNPNTDPSKLEERLILKPRATTFTADDDGIWYFHISVRDNAGNWSEPLHLAYFRDTTPPDPIAFIRPGTDAFGALSSNSPVLAWGESSEEDLAGYSYSLSYLGQDPFDMDRFTIARPPERVMTTDRAIKLSNRDNGYWALVVGSLDTTGNMGESEIFYFYMNKYIPVTYISWVGSSKNREESIVLDIRGRGFSENGEIVRVLVDRDGKAPWDYEYYLNEDYQVSSDRIISGPVIDDMREGIYYIGVVHPLRGTVFASSQIKLDSTGNVKFGDFTSRFESTWSLLENRAFRLALNRVAFYLIILFLIGLGILSALRLTAIGKEQKELVINARALVRGTHMVSDLTEERLISMKKRGVGLRLKFTMAFLGLVLSVVLMVAVVLGNFMITTQQISLGEELEKRSIMITNTLASSAENYLPSSNRIELSLLPQQISAMEESLNTTITGKGYSDPDNYNYIWASNREDVNEYQQLPENLSARDYNSVVSKLTEEEADLFSLFYLENEGSYIFNEELRERSPECARLMLNAEYLTPFSVGNTPYWDMIEEDLNKSEDQINSQAAERVTDMVRDYEQLNQEGTALVLRSDEASKAKLAEIQETQSLLSQQIDETLDGITNSIGVRSYPPFNPEELLLLGPDERIFTYYKPLIYRERGSETYYKGAVRLQITAEPLINQIIRTRQNIFYITGLTILIAVAASIIGAVFMSSTMVRPIRQLAGHVQLIRDSDDITTLESRLIKLKSKDEIGELGDNINQMTLQLIKAAAANKELIVGKDIQKTYLPLEVPEGQKRKMTTTGTKSDENLEWFGYYEGAKGVSGDYFDVRPLDENHYAIIKCDISGKGIAASFLMSMVATVFVSYCKELDPSKKIDLPPLLYNINDLIYDIGFQGRFAAFTILIINKKTGVYNLAHAGDSLQFIYDSDRKELVQQELNEAPAAGQIDSFLVEMKAPYMQSQFQLKRGDLLFLFTDGIEESKTFFRDKDFNPILCEDENHKTSEGWGHNMGTDGDEMTLERIHDYVNQVMHRGSYELKKYHTANPDQKYEFNFDSCEGTIEEATISLLALEKVWRLHPYNKVAADHILQLDAKVEVFLQKHFVQFSDFFKAEHRELREEFPEYVYYRHLDEDDQTDDLTCLVIRRN